MASKIRRLIWRKPDVALIEKIPGVRGLFHPTDWSNRFRFGFASPRYGETIYINPQDVKGILRPRSKNISGSVVSDFPPSPDHYIISIREHGKINCCLEKWEKGIEWSETEYLRGQLSRQNYKYGRTPEEQNKNWAKYDVLLDHIRRDGRLKSRGELYRGNFRETTGVLIHIGKNGALYQGDSGNRRFAASLFSGLTEIPAQVGCVHISALDTFHQMRLPRECRG